MITDKPAKPGGPLECSNITPESCTLSWNPPADDGGIPVSNYVVEKQDLATGKYCIPLINAIRFNSIVEMFLIF